MGLPYAGRSTEEHIALFLQDMVRGQIEKTFLRSGGIEGEVEVLKTLDFPEASLLEAPGNSAVLACFNILEMSCFLERVLRVKEIFSRLESVCSQTSLVARSPFSRDGLPKAGVFFGAGLSEGRSFFPKFWV